MCSGFFDGEQQVPDRPIGVGCSGLVRPWFRCGSPSSGPDCQPTGPRGGDIGAPAPMYIPGGGIDAARTLREASGVTRMCGEPARWLPLGVPPRRWPGGAWPGRSTLHACAPALPWPPPGRGGLEAPPCGTATLPCGTMLPCGRMRLGLHTLCMGLPGGHAPMSAAAAAEAASSSRQIPSGLGGTPLPWCISCSVVSRCHAMRPCSSMRLRLMSASACRRGWRRRCWFRRVAVAAANAAATWLNYHGQRFCRLCQGQTAPFTPVWRRRACRRACAVQAQARARSP
mmetsp:Transcript_29458/g.87126  ORF Transcript_29458/g.87126 Transcript_29458/m.87126 type:complete len:285 (-) Transcript_29458:302-1156(-)